MRETALSLLLHDVGTLCADADVPPTPEECDELLDSCSFVMFEVAGLAERIRAGLNGTEVPHPVKPYNPPPPPPPPAKPADPPPPPPPPPPTDRGTS